MDNFDTKNDQDGQASSEVHQKKSQRKKYLFSFCFMLVLIGITSFYIFRGNKLGTILDLLGKVSLPFVALGICSILLSYVSQGLIIGAAGRCVAVRFTFWEMLQYSFIGLFYSLITPSSTGGQPMQFYYMCRDKLDPSKTALTLFITNITYQISVVVMGLFLLFYRWNFFMQYKGFIWLFFVGLIVNLAALFILVGIMLSPKALSALINFFIRLLAKTRLMKHPEKAYASTKSFTTEVSAGLELIRKNKLRFVGIVAMTLFQLITYHGVSYFVYRAFGFNSHCFLDVLAISSTLFVAISFFPLPGTVGAAETGFLYIYSTVFGAFLMPAMLLSRFITFYSMLILSGLFSAFVQLRKPYNIGRRNN